MWYRSHVNFEPECEEEDSDWNSNWWDDGKDDFSKERSFLAFVSRNVTTVKNEIHEESCEEEASKNGADEAAGFEVFFSYQGLVLFVH